MEAVTALNPINTMQNLRCDTLPFPVWRVQHEESRAKFRGGDLVSESDHEPQNEASMRHLVTMHLRWGHSNEESPFLSVFDNRQMAVIWGEQRAKWFNRQRGGGADVKLFRVDCSSMQDMVIFKVSELLTQLNLNLNRDTSHEYLILRRIPANNIRQDMNISDSIVQGMRRLAEA